MKTPLVQQVEEQILNSYDSMYRLAFTYVNNQEDAMDIVQESVYKAIKNASNVSHSQYIKTWLWRIVMNTALDFIRKNKREISVDSFFENAKDDIYPDFDTIAALDILDEKERAVIILRYFEDYKIQDVATILNENINTIKSILYRSLKKLKVKLTEGELAYER